MKHALILNSALLSVFCAATVWAADTPDKKFIDQATAGGITEIGLSKLALERSADPAVKALAETMIDDHTRLNDELIDLCATRGFARPSQLMPAAQQKVYDDLAKLSGPKFDREYTRVLLDGHHKTITLFEREVKQGTDAELKAWAGKTLPTLKHHREMIQDLSKSMKKS